MYKNNNALSLALPPAAAACLIYALSMGLINSYGILLQSLLHATGLSYQALSVVMSIAQLVLGIAPPLFGIIALKTSNKTVLSYGLLLMALGFFSIPFSTSLWALILAEGLLIPAGAGALSFGFLMGAFTDTVGEDSALAYSGLITAGSGLGSILLSPLIQYLLDASGLLLTMALVSAFLILCSPITLPFFTTPSSPIAATAKTRSASTWLKKACRSRTYLCVTAAFFTCGFHMAILMSHLFSQYTSYGMPKEEASLTLSLYGAVTIVGCLCIGALCQRVQLKTLLIALYASRAVAAIFFLIAPKADWILFAFAAFSGFTGVSTVPPTSGLISRHFGAASLGLLLGISFFLHQIGGFTSAWLGGWIVTETGAYDGIWLLDIILSAGAALLCLLIQETPQKMDTSHS